MGPFFWKPYGPFAGRPEVTLCTWRGVKNQELANPDAEKWADYSRAEGQTATSMIRLNKQVTPPLRGRHFSYDYVKWFVGLTANLKNSTGIGSKFELC